MGYKYCLFYIENNGQIIIGYYNSQEEMQQKLNNMSTGRQYFCQKYVRIPIPIPIPIRSSCSHLITV